MPSLERSARSVASGSFSRENRAFFTAVGDRFSRSSCEIARVLTRGCRAYIAARRNPVARLMRIQGKRDVPAQSLVPSAIGRQLPAPSVMIVGADSLLATSPQCTGREVPELRFDLLEIIPRAPATGRIEMTGKEALAQLRRLRLQGLRSVSGVVWAASCVRTAASKHQT